MGIIFTTLAALLGSLFGAAARDGVGLAQRQAAGEGGEPSITLNASIIASASVGLITSLVGGSRLAFWLGAVLGAAGADRLDEMLFGRVGFDPADLVARATGALQSPGEEIPAAD